MTNLLSRLALLLLLVAVSAAAVAQTSTVVVLVRHAEKQGGTDPSLSEDGVARATALRDVLLHAGVDALFSSQFRRTVETLEPLADTLGLEVEPRPLESSDVKSSAREVMLLLAEQFRGQTIVIAGHSNTIPTMASALTGMEIEDYDERDYDNLLIVVLNPGSEPQLIRSKYGAPDGFD